MNLFTYLMSKKGYNYLPHDDLFSYLLGKNNSIPNSASGTEITINSRKGVLISLELDKESTQNSTTGKQLFDINGTVNAGTLDKYNNGFKLTQSGGYRFLNISFPNEIPAGTYKLTYDIIGYTVSSLYNVTAEIRSGSTNRATLHINANGENTFTISDSADRLYIYIPSSQDADTYVTLDNVMISVNGGVYEEYTGGQPSPSPDYPQEINTITTSITITVTDSENNTKTKTIPLGNNEIAGIGDYKDELIVDKNGHCWLNKKIGKYIFDGSQTITKHNTALSTLGYYYTIPFSPNAYYTSNNIVVDKMMCTNFKVVNNNASLFTNGKISLSGTKDKVCIGYEGTTEDLDTYLTNNNTTIYYILETPQLIDLDYTINMTIFKGNNTITNDKNAYMQIEYF